MPKIQGKQIADNTITQDNLNLSTPSSGDTLSGTTVAYVNDYVSNFVSTHSGTIGPAEDGGYTDGIFLDFTENTPIGTAVDRFNEMFLLLAPAAPSKNWSIFGNFTLGNSYTATAIGTVSPTYNNITSTETPSYTLSISSIGIRTNARERVNATFVMSGDTTLETAIMTTSSLTKSSGIIRWTAADPYLGDGVGKEGFWSGITSMSVSGTAPQRLSSPSTYNISFYHTVGTGSPSTFDYYVNTVLTPTITNISATFPMMTRYISGVPSISNDGTKYITNVNFTINNSISYFYTRNLFNISGTASTQSGYLVPTNTPLISGQTVVESGKTLLINQPLDTESMTVTITAKNAAGGTGSGSLTSNVYRIDNSSIENRLTSGSGNYPSNWGGLYDSTITLNDSNSYSNELMLLNNRYKYPSGNYSTYINATNGAGPNYNTNVTGTRWSTFNIGTFTNNKSFYLNINGSTGISSIGQSDLFIEIKISGATYWVDGDSNYSGGGNPGSIIDGVAANVYNASGTSATVRMITFGSPVYTGNIIVRIGITQGSSITFTSLSASNII